MVENGGEIVATSERLSEFGLITRKDPRSNQVTGTGVRLIGIDVAREREVLPWDEILNNVKDQDGALASFFEVCPNFVPEDDKTRADPFSYTNPRTNIEVREPGIILGSWLARQLWVERGDRVSVITGRVPKAGVVEQDDVETVTERFVVVGCFDTGRYDYDSIVAFCDIDTVRDVLDREGASEGVYCRIVDPDRSEEVKAALADEYGGVLKIETWRDRVRTLAEALDVEKGVMLIIMFFIVLVAGASICGILYMLVLEKTRDIGILLSMGATPLGITGVFLAYGGILGLAGCGLGTLLGLEVVWNLTAITDFLDEQFGLEIFPADIYQFKEIPTKVNAGEISQLVLGTLLTSLLASVLPAFRAARLDPVKCLGYE